MVVLYNFILSKKIIILVLNFFSIIGYHNLEEMNGCLAQQCTPRCIGLLSLWKVCKNSFRVGYIGIEEVLVTG